MASEWLWPLRAKQAGSVRERVVCALLRVASSLLRRPRHPVAVAAVAFDVERVEEQRADARLDAFVVRAAVTGQTHGREEIAVQLVREVDHRVTVTLAVAGRALELHDLAEDRQRRVEARAHRLLAGGAQPLDLLVDLALEVVPAGVAQLRDMAGALL